MSLAACDKGEATPTQEVQQATTGAHLEETLVTMPGNTDEEASVSIPGNAEGETPDATQNTMDGNTGDHVSEESMPTETTQPAATGSVATPPTQTSQPTTSGTQFSVSTPSETKPTATTPAHTSHRYDFSKNREKALDKSSPRCYNSKAV